MRLVEILFGEGDEDDSFPQSNAGFFILEWSRDSNSHSSTSTSHCQVFVGVTKCFRSRIGFHAYDSVEVYYTTVILTPQSSRAICSPSHF